MSNCPFNQVYVCVCSAYVHVSPLFLRLDTVVGPSPRPLRSRVKNISSPSLHLYYSQARRKQSAPGLDSPHPDMLPSCFPVNITKLWCHTWVNQCALACFGILSDSLMQLYVWTKLKRDVCSLSVTQVWLKKLSSSSSNGLLTVFCHIGNYMIILIWATWGLHLTGTICQLYVAVDIRQSFHSASLRRRIQFVLVLKSPIQNVNA